MNLIIFYTRGSGYLFSGSGLVPYLRGYNSYRKGYGININLGSTHFGKQDDYSTLPYYKIIRHNISN